VEIIRQKSFSPPSNRELLKKLDDEPLVVHRRQDGGEGILIFVHGLGGSRYGEDSTWGKFPEFLYEDFLNCDLGRREEALAAAQEAADLYRGLARARPEAFTPNLAASLNNLANSLSGL